MSNIPNREGLEKLLATGIPEIVETLIAAHKLPYKVVDGKLSDYTEGAELWLSKFITVNQQMIALKDTVRRLVNINDPVLIVGPTGTGKELIARALHGNRKGNFLGINCAGLPTELIESELFGHVQGSFTGASKTKEGMMTEAQDGTLLLDEIGDFPMQVQGKLLRAIQEQRIRKVGSNKEEIINCRIVCATHKNLVGLIDKELFREDLYARISTFELETLPLHKRPEDIIPIIESLPNGKKFIQALGKTMKEEDWKMPVMTPLNVRSLQKIVRRYEVLGII